MARLSDFVGTVPDYIELAWVTAPNADGQDIPIHVLTKLTLNTIVADTGGLVNSLVDSEFTLPPGTYYFEAHTAAYQANNNGGGILGLYQGTTPITRSNSEAEQASGYMTCYRLSGQFVLTSSTALNLKLLVAVACDIDSRSGITVMTNSTPDADQRTTIKLWKLK